MIWYALALTTSLLLATFFSKPKLRVNKITYNNYLDFSVRDYKHLRNFICIFIIASLPLVIMAIRYKVGTDYAGTYTYDFYYIKSGARSRNEILSYVLYKIAIFFSDDVQGFFILTSIICVLGSYIAIFRLSVNPLYSIAMYFFTYQYFTSMNGVRQAVATSVIMLFIPCLLKKEYKKFIIGVAIAGFIHYASFLYIVLLPIFILNTNYKKALIAIVGLFIGTQVLRNHILSLISRTVYAHYLGTSVEYNASFIFIVINTLVLIVMIVYYRNCERYKFWLNIQVLILAICSIQGIIPLAGRVLQLFSALRMFILPEIYVNIKNPRYRFLFKWGVLALYFAYCLYGLIYANWDDVLPYNIYIGKY